MANNNTDSTSAPSRSGRVGWSQKYQQAGYRLCLAAAGYPNGSPFCYKTEMMYSNARRMVVNKLRNLQYLNVFCLLFVSNSFKGPCFTTNGSWFCDACDRSFHERVAVQICVIGASMANLSELEEAL